VLNEHIKTSEGGSSAYVSVYVPGSKLQGILIVRCANIRDKSTDVYYGHSHASYETKQCGELAGYQEVGRANGTLSLYLSSHGHYNTMVATDRLVESCVVSSIVNES